MPSVIRSVFTLLRFFALPCLAAARAALAAELPVGAWEKLPPHPRLFARAAHWQALKQQIRTDAVSGQLYAVARANAENFLTAPPVAYVDTGAFLHGPMRQGQGRILALALAYRIEGDARFLARARQEMKAMAALPNWYPQHFLDTGDLLAARSHRGLREEARRVGNAGRRTRGCRCRPGRGVAATATAGRECHHRRDSGERCSRRSRSRSRRQ